MSLRGAEIGCPLRRKRQRREMGAVAPEQGCRREAGCRRTLRRADESGSSVLPAQAPPLRRRHRWQQDPCRIEKGIMTKRCPQAVSRNDEDGLRAFCAMYIRIAILEASSYYSIFTLFFPLMSILYLSSPF